ncbi:MAG: LPS export ABC transporter periplasmic protein LptC [Halieaceae bacterium]|nr:LPS export ABC transporter periplasmic protein LptC [Halieaceae bacterium]
MAKSSSGLRPVKLTFSSLLLMAVAIFFWITLGRGDEVVPSAPLTSASVADSYLERAERWSYDPSGMRIQYLTIGSGKTYINDPVTYAEDLTFWSPDNSGNHWQMTATEGQLYTEIKELLLLKGVEIKQFERNASMQTAHIRLLLNENRAITDAKVQLFTANSTTTATGLDLDLTSSEAKLLKEVETRYAK